MCPVIQNNRRLRIQRITRKVRHDLGLVIINKNRPKNICAAFGYLGV